MYGTSPLCTSQYILQYITRNRMKSMLEDLCCIDCARAFDCVSEETTDISVGELYSHGDTASNPANFMREERAHLSYATSWTSNNTCEYESDSKMKKIILIQAFIRRSIARRKAEVEKIRRGAREKMDRLKRHHAAVRIQLFVRSIIAKNAYRDKFQERSAIRLQSRARGMIARKNVRDLRNLIENHARKLVARQKEEKMDQQLFVAKSKPMHVDCNPDMPHSMSKNLAEGLNRETSEVKVLEEKAILIQTWARIIIARKRVFPNLRNVSAVMLQSRVRGMLVRNRIQKQKQKQKQIRNISITEKVDGTVLPHQSVDGTTIGKMSIASKRQAQNNKVRVALPKPSTSTSKQNRLFKNSASLQKGGISASSRPNTFKTSPTLGVSTTKCNAAHKNKDVDERIRKENAVILIQNHIRCLCARRKVAKLRAQIIEAEIETKKLPLVSSSIALFGHTPTMSLLTHDDGSEMLYCENSIVASTAMPPKRKSKKGLKTFLTKTWEKQSEETKKIATIEGSVLPHPLSFRHSVQSDQASTKTDGEGHTTTTVASTVSYFNELVSNLSLSSCIGFGISSSSLEVCGLSTSKSGLNKSSHNINTEETVTCNGLESLDHRDEEDYKLEPENHRQLPEISIRYCDGSIECNEAKREPRKSKMMAAIKFDKKAKSPVDHNTTGKKPKMAMSKFFSRNRSFGKVQEISTKTTGQKKSSNENTSKPPLGKKINPDTKKNVYTALQDVPGKITKKKRDSGTNVPKRNTPTIKKKDSDMKNNSSKDFPGKVTSKRRDVGANTSKKDNAAAKKMVLDTKKKPEKASKNVNNKVANKKRDSGAYTSKKDTPATKKMDPDMKNPQKKIAGVTFIPVSLSSFHNQSVASKSTKEDTCHTISTSEKDIGSTKKEAPSAKQNKKKSLRKWFSREIDKPQDGEVDGCDVKDLVKNREKVYGRTVSVAYFQ